MSKLAKYCQTGIKISPSKKGTFTAQATKMGMGIKEAARTILNAPEGRYTPLMRRKANFAKNFAKQTGGENGIIAEAGEFYKDENGQIKQINPDTVTHDDYLLIDEQGNYISKMPYNQGGVAINDAEKILSATHEARDEDANSYTQADEDIRIKPKEGKEFAKRFNFDNIKFNGGSPSKLFDSVLEAKTKKLKKYNNIEYNENSIFGINSSKANGAFVESLPADELIFDEIFDYQESKKQENYGNDIMQSGGFPERYKKMGFSRANQVKNAPQGDSHKKMVVAKKGNDYKLVKFGYRGMEDYTQHKDESRRKSYLARSGGIRNKSGKLTKDDVFSANHWSRKVLWQTGGKGVLSPYPEIYGNKPVAMVNIKGKLYPATTVDGRIVSMDDVFNKRDSVELKNFKAIKLNKNERPKK